MTLQVSSNCYLSRWAFKYAGKRAKPRSMRIKNFTKPQVESWQYQRDGEGKRVTVVYQRA